jgi:hypothetical protein
MPGVVSLFFGVQGALRKPIYPGAQDKLTSAPRHTHLMPGGAQCPGPSHMGVQSIHPLHALQLLMATHARLRTTIRPKGIWWTGQDCFFVGRWAMPIFWGERSPCNMLSSLPLHGCRHMKSPVCQREVPPPARVSSCASAAGADKKYTEGIDGNANRHHGQ